MSTINDVSFQLLRGQFLNSVAQVSEATTVLVLSFGKLFDHAELDVQWWDKCPASVYQRVAYDIPCLWNKSFWKALIPNVQASLSSCNAQFDSLYSICEPDLF